MGPIGTTNTIHALDDVVETARYAASSVFNTCIQYIVLLALGLLQRGYGLCQLRAMLSHASGQSSVKLHSNNFGWWQTAAEGVTLVLNNFFLFLLFLGQGHHALWHATLTSWAIYIQCSIFKQCLFGQGGKGFRAMPCHAMLHHGFLV